MVDQIARLISRLHGGLTEVDHRVPRLVRLELSVKEQVGRLRAAQILRQERRVIAHQVFGVSEFCMGIPSDSKDISPLPACLQVAVSEIG